jgi:hypothetical protein
MHFSRFLNGRAKLGKTLTAVRGGGVPEESAFFSWASAEMDLIICWACSGVTLNLVAKSLATSGFVRTAVMGSGLHNKVGDPLSLLSVHAIHDCCPRWVLSRVLSGGSEKSLLN